MTSNDSITTARERLVQLAEQLDACDATLAAGSPAERRAALLSSAVVALQYARQTAGAIFGSLDAEAATEVRRALDGLVEAAPQPWGDSALNDLDRICDRSAKLLADVWMVARLTVAADPQSWSNETMVQQCLQVVAETHLAGKLRAELEGMFGSVDEPGS